MNIKIHVLMNHNIILVKTLCCLSKELYTRDNVNVNVNVNIDNIENVGNR